MTSQHILLHLSLISGVGPATVRALMAAYGVSDLNALYNAHAAEIALRCGISSSVAQLIVKGLADARLLERELELIHKHQIQVLTWVCDEYPSMLAAIGAPPPVLYVQGAPLYKNFGGLAFVGSRKADLYGQRTINMLVPDAVRNGWVIVSGGALGADTMAHQAALQAHGATVAVLGSGLLKPYPARNTKLFEAMAASGGSIVSCFPLTMEALPGNFPARNRVIAGLSRGCVVIQAARKSGALITALFALEQGREVFAVPGPIDHELSGGCHYLISQGATLCGAFADVAAVLARPVCSIPVAVSSSAAMPMIEKVYQPAKLIAPSAHEQYGTGLHGKIVGMCATPRSNDELLDECAISFSELHDVLFSLAVEGALVQDHAGLWRTP